MVSLSPIGLGTGGPSYLTDDQCVDIVSSALEAGYRHVDTAQGYGNEAEVGAGVAKAAVPREEVTVATKLDRPNMGRDDVRQTARASADRLGIGSIDVLYAHFPTDMYDAEETIPAMCELVDSGIVRHIGVSNFTPEEVSAAREIATHPIVANQIEMHPLYQREDQVTYAQEHDLYIVAYSPLAQGEIFSIPELKRIAEKHGVSEATVTLAWLTDKDNVVAIPKTTSKHHLEANLASTTVDLDPEDIATIEGIEREEPIYDY